MSGGRDYGKDFGSKQTIYAPRTVADPSESLKRVIQENQDLKQVNQTVNIQLQQAIQQLQDMQNEMKELAKFRQILRNPIEKLTVELYDANLLRTIRGHMVQMWGVGGQLDAEGRWAQTVVNERLQLMARQLMFVGLQRWPQVKAQLEEIIKTQGLRK